MASRDYLIRQFEEMGFFLASLLRKALKMKEDNQQEQAEATVKEELMQELKLDIGQVVMLENQEFLTLIKSCLTSEDQMEKLADILYVLGQDLNLSFSLTKANYLRKSLFLFSYLQENSPVFSYERRTKMLSIQDILRLKGLTD
ncbi:MAG: hypothetical protein JNL03_05490 [Prolixibacteraceae bacterium]|nr:hypothetical protein [Prolixibacteraceae bacterium]